MNKQPAGENYLLHGFSLIFQPGLRRFVFIPILINVIVYLLLLGTAYHFVKELTHWLMHLLPHWLAWLSWIIWPLFILSVLVFIVYTFTLLANIISSPFNSFLSEKIELLITGKRVSSGTWQDALKSLPTALAREWQKIKYYLPKACLLLVFSFIPGIGILISLLWFFFGSWMMAIQYLDYPMDNHKIPFDEMLKKLKSSYFSNFVFGASAMLLSCIPILNLFVIPAAVAGATLKFHHEYQNDLSNHTT